MNPLLWVGPSQRHVVQLKQTDWAGTTETAEGAVPTEALNVSKSPAVVDTAKQESNPNTETTVPKKRPSAGHTYYMAAIEGP